MEFFNRLFGRYRVLKSYLEKIMEVQPIVPEEPAGVVKLHPAVCVVWSSQTPCGVKTYSCYSTVSGIRELVEKLADDPDTLVAHTWHRMDDSDVRAARCVYLQDTSGAQGEIDDVNITGLTQVC